MLAGVDRIPHQISSNFDFASRDEVQSQYCITARFFQTSNAGALPSSPSPKGVTGRAVVSRMHVGDPNALINIAHKARMYLRLKSEPLEHYWRLVALTAKSEHGGLRYLKRTTKAAEFHQTAESNIWIGPAIARAGTTHQPCAPSEHY